MYLQNPKTLGLHNRKNRLMVYYWRRTVKIRSLAVFPFFIVFRFIEISRSNNITKYHTENGRFSLNTCYLILYLFHMKCIYKYARAYTHTCDTHTFSYEIPHHYCDIRLYGRILTRKLSRKCLSSILMNFIYVVCKITRNNNKPIFFMCYLDV